MCIRDSAKPDRGKLDRPSRRLCRLYTDPIPGGGEPAKHGLDRRAERAAERDDGLYPECSGRDELLRANPKR